MSEPVFPVGWITAENVESDTVPPFAVVEIRSIDASSGIAKIGKPADDDQVTVFFNGPAPILPGHKGQIHQTMPCIAAYLADGDAGADPAHGEEWGTVADSWHLHEGHTGFTVIGAGGFGLCNVQRTFAGGGGGGEVDTEEVEVVTSVECSGGSLITTTATVNSVVV